MRILKPIGEELIFDDKVRHLLFNINVIDDIQEHFDMYIVDVINSIFEAENKDIKRESYNRLAYMLTALLKEDVRLHNKNNPSDQWDDITEEFVKSELLTNDTSLELGLLLLKSFNGSLPNGGDKDPNHKSSQQKN